MNFSRPIIIAQLWHLKSQNVEKMWIFCVFFGKRPFIGQFSKLCYCVPKGFIATPIDVLCSNFVKFDWRKSVKVKSRVRCALEGKSNIWLKPSFEPKKQWFSVYRFCSERLLRGAFDWFLTIMSLPLRFRCSCTQTSLHVQDVTFDSSFKKCTQLF